MLKTNGIPRFGFIIQSVSLMFPTGIESSFVTVAAPSRGHHDCFDYTYQYCFDYIYEANIHYILSLITRAHLCKYLNLHAVRSFECKDPDKSEARSGISRTLACSTRSGENIIRRSDSSEPGAISFPR